MKEKILDFYMNNCKWTIYEVEEKVFWEDDGKLEEMKEDNGYFFGRCKYVKQEIWLCNEIPLEQRKKTLYHELLHCYKGCYITFEELNNMPEDFCCDLFANSHDIIHSIVEEYIARKKYEKEQD